jgi:hypothetical protein
MVVIASTTCCCLVGGGGPKRRHFVFGATIERLEHRSSPCSEPQQAAAGVGFGRRADQQFPGFEPAKDAAQIARVEPEIAPQFGGGRRLAVGEFVEDAHFRQRIRAVEQVVGEHPDFPGVKPVEGADRVDRARRHDSGIT